MQLSHRALRRRAKKFLKRQEELGLFLPVLPGFEGVAADELIAAGYGPDIIHGGVSFRGGLAAIYEVNLSHRTGSRVLLRVDQFAAKSYPMLYHHTKRAAWEALLGNCPTVGVRAAFRGSRLRHNAHIEEVVFEAISARLGRFGLAVQHAAYPAITVYARIFRDRCTLSLDTTGDHLHKRGYRTETVEGPLRETSAAGLLMMANAGRYDAIVDPFCGSGTIVIEADMLVRNAAPGSFRTFAIESSPMHSKGTLAEVRRQVTRRSNNAAHPRILGLDLQASAIEVAQRCAKRAGTVNASFAVANALSINFDALLHEGQRGLIACNVPYGVRLGSRDSAVRLLNEFWSRLRETAQHWDFVIVSAAGTPIHSASFRPDRRITFRNGGLPVEAQFGRVSRGSVR